MKIELTEQEIKDGKKWRRAIKIRTNLGRLLKRLVHNYLSASPK